VPKKEGGDARPQGAVPLLARAASLGGPLFRETTARLGVFVRLRGKDSNLDYLIQSYPSAMTTRIGVWSEVLGLEAI
jgi:hypothetical protein